jgi:hypothetical protein
MTTRAAFRPFSKRPILVASVLLISGLGLTGFLAFRRPPRFPMEQYVPASALAFFEIDSLGQLASGLTSTAAWKQLAPPLGISSQLGQVGEAADLMGRIGLGPSEAVIAGRAQYALAITGLDSDSGTGDDGPYIHLKPHFVLIVQTHSKPEAAASLVRDRAEILARRIYGDSTSRRADDYRDIGIQIFSGAEPGHEFIAAAASDLVLIGNDEPSVKAVIDVIGHRLPSLADSQPLKHLRETVDRNASVFAFLTPAGVEKIAGIAPALLAGRFASSPEQLDNITNLLQHMSGQAVLGVLYGSEFTSDGITDRYLTVLNPSMAGELENLIKPAQMLDLGQLRMIPPSAESFTVLSATDIGSLPERGLKSLAPEFDLVGSLALKELVLNLRKQMGLEGSDSIEKTLGDQLTVVRFSDNQPAAILVALRDEAGIAPYLGRYLGRDGSPVSTEQYGGYTIRVSTNEAGRAAVVAGNVLILATRNQIVEILDYFKNGGRRTDRITQAISDRPGAVAIVSCNLNPRGAGETMLAVSRITRVTDGSPELLEKDQVRKAVESLPPSVSFTRFEDSGIYTETRSATGNLGLLTSFNSRD